MVSGGGDTLEINQTVTATLTDDDASPAQLAECNMAVESKHHSASHCNVGFIYHGHG